MKPSARSRLVAAVVVLVVTGLASAATVSVAVAQGAETAGMLTEVKIGKGQVEVKAGAGDWRRAAPLQTLRAGDQVRASVDAVAVVLLSSGRGTVRVDASSSPYVVSGPVAGDSASRKAQTLLAASLGFLSSGAKEPGRVNLSTRGGTRPPEILTPRNGPVLPDSLVFEWLGSQFSRYTIRVLDPSGVVLERKVSGGRFTYPADAPTLQSGVRYRVQILALNQAPYEAWFEVLDAGRVSAVRDEIAQLTGALGLGAPPSSVAAVVAGGLASEGLFHDARLVALAALAKDPDEPSLLTLLGNLYLKTGLPQQATEAFDEAQFLMSRAK